MPINIHPNRRLFPQNNRLPNVAKQRLNQVAPLVQQQFQNALQVNGISCLIYSQMLNGQPCTCSALHGEKFQTSSLNPDGTAPQSMIDTLLMGGKFGIQDYARQITKAQDTRPDPIVFADIERSMRNFGEGTLLSDPIAENLIDIPIDSNQQQFNDQESGACHVCYGTGYVGGYTLLNGLRQIITSNSELNNIVLFNCTIDTLVSPYEVESLGDDAYFEFTITLPKSTTVNIHRLTLWKGDEVITKGTFYHVNTNLSLTLVTITNLNTYCDGSLHKFRVFNFDRFTHVEIQLYFGNIEYLDYPLLTKLANLGQLDSIENVSLNLGAKVPQLKPWDIISDLTYGKLWRVEDSHQHNDARMNIYGWTCSARVVQYYEILGSLYNGQPVYQRPTLEDGIKPLGNKIAKLPRL